MMSNSLDTKVSIGKLFQDYAFRVPIYQRNYAWGEEEIEQLLNDINENKGSQNYYLGTLVLYKNDDKYDVIDGQQRLTTLYLLNKILSSIGNDNLKVKNKLAFESRPKTTGFFGALYDNNSLEEIEELCDDTVELDNFDTAIRAIIKFFKQDLKSDDDAIMEFNKKCFEHTYVFTTELPEKTDVNHYFEIMNNRGEQLEKHEILKAKFLDELDGTYSKENFSTIWEACSQMDNHVQYYFDTDSRKHLFSERFDQYPTDEIIENFLKKHQKEKDNSKDASKEEDYVGFEILKSHKLNIDFKQEEKGGQIDRFKSIIDFENFLLQVLSLIKGYDDTNLEDKNLLKNFGYEKDSKIKFPNSLLFLKKLLQVRFLFDKYVVKREMDENKDNDWIWAIRNFSSYDKTYVQNNTFSDDSWSEKLTMIQSMFQVTYSPNVNKTWLLKLLQHVVDKHEHRRSESLFNFLYNIMAERFSESGFELTQGLQTPRSAFNFLDYLLWEEYYENIRGKESKNDLPEDVSEYRKALLTRIDKLKLQYKDFRFTQRNSIEHFFPQSKIDDLELSNNNDSIRSKEKIINSFGNLCLISSSSNSSYNNEHPVFKKSKGRSKNESLKQQMMFGAMDEVWGQKEIEEHQKEVVDLLNTKLKLKKKNSE